jgi:C4-dicarboxylate transporter, DctM subunit
MSGIMLGTMVLCFALTISVAVSIGLAAILGIQASNAHMLISVKEMFNSINKFPLAAIPFFILAGNLMETGGISRRLVEFAKSIVGGVQGGLPMTCVLTCMIFAAVSGSSVATTFAIGAILVPALIRHGYPTEYAAALQATSAELGVIIPPSIPMILYGVSAEVSIGELFIAGVGPGILIGVSLMAFVHVYCRIKGWGKADGDGRLPFGKATLQAGWALLMPVIILGGIYGGIFTPTEASAVAVLYALVIGVVIYREIQLPDLWKILRKSVISSAVIMFIIANAGLFAFLLTRAGVPDAIGHWLEAVLQSPCPVPAGGERGAVRHRDVHRNQRRDHRARSHPRPGGDALRRGPGALRDDHGGEPGARHDHAALRREPVRRLHRRADFPGPDRAAAAALRGRGAGLPDGHHLPALALARAA